MARPNSNARRRDAEVKCPATAAAAAATAPRRSQPPRDNLTKGRHSLGIHHRRLRRLRRLVLNNDNNKG